ncbi:MAG TPA: hypothetical protein VNO81_01835 [Candidatus Nitrosotenuis sp.]|jgi:hypothetical protein|nr:hypothetical protein [Candidatus Nitrosotenuis sp.]
MHIRANPPLPPPPRETAEVNFADGADHPLELALLPSLDLVLGNVVGDTLQQGRPVEVHGEITCSERPGWKQLIQVRMWPNRETGHISVQGSYGGPEGATFVREEAAPDPGSLQPSVVGRVATVPEGEDNELLSYELAPGTVTLRGQVDGRAVEASMSLDPWHMEMNHQGNLGGVDFQRTLDLHTHEVKGRLGVLAEQGQVSVNPDGTLQIVREIGPYRVEERVRFPAF